METFADPHAKIFDKIFPRAVQKESDVEKGEEDKTPVNAEPSEQAPASSDPKKDPEPITPPAAETPQVDVAESTTALPTATNADSSDESLFIVHHCYRSRLSDIEEVDEPEEESKRRGSSSRVAAARK